jgi:hypothetical protein
MLVAVPRSTRERLDSCILVSMKAQLRREYYGKSENGPKDRLKGGRAMIAI